MTFEEYIQNPMGEKNSVVSNRAMYGRYYQEKLDTIMVREAGQVHYKAYKDKSRYIIYIKIPSEVVPKFYYDVLIEFREPKEGIVGNDLSKYKVRFYSNDPSFVFTFAHAFKKNGIFFSDYDDKMSQRALKEKADEKNPKDIVGYVKSLYFAYLIMKRRGLFSKTLYVDNYDAQFVHKGIMDADKKIQLRQEAGKKISVENTKSKQRQKDMTSKRNNQNPETPVNKNFTGKVKQTRMAKVTKSKKSSNTIKATKKVGIK